MKQEASPPLRIFCVEDNPLIVFHIEQMIEDAGHVFAGFADSLSQLETGFDHAVIDGALVDIDLADGCTGPDVAMWLKKRGVASVFVTGQEQIAAAHAGLALGVIPKPISGRDLADKLELFRGYSPPD